MLKNESGRSMVEMLGVLAIIGVLSVGGIAGYTMAMNKYRANEILNLASLVAVEGIAAGANKAATDVGGVPPSISSYVSAVAYDHANTKVTVTCSKGAAAEPCKTAKSTAPKNTQSKEVIGDVLLEFSGS